MDPTDLNPLSEQIIGAAFEVLNTLGPGFLELSLQGLEAISQAPLPVAYKGQPIGIYEADILVENAIIVELKCTERLAPEHTAQCLNYLKASGKTLCLLLNFQRPRLEIKRLAL
jgi:GxxExxY protein